jgi:hypothetical protein
LHQGSLTSSTKQLGTSGGARSKFRSYKNAASHGDASERLQACQIETRPMWREPGVRAGMTSCVANNSRMKRELLPALAYPTINKGIRPL